MSWYAVAIAGATVVSGYYSAQQTRKARYASAAERKRAARESLLTAKYNINERNKESRQTQFETLDTGGALIQKIAVAGKQAEGSATVSAGSSGAIAETGSSRAAIESIVKQHISAQTEVLLDTKHRIKAIARDTENINKSEWRNAKLNQTQQNRVANVEGQAAEGEYKAGLLNTVVAGASTYGSLKGSPSSKPETIQTGKGGQHVRSPVKIRSTSASTPSIYKNKGITNDQAYKNWMKTKGRRYKLPWLK